MTLISLCSISLLITNFAAWTFISWLNMIVRVNVVLNRTVAVNNEWNLCDSHLQSKKKKREKKREKKRRGWRKGVKKKEEEGWTYEVWTLLWELRIVYYSVTYYLVSLWSCLSGLNFVPTAKGRTWVVVVKTRNISTKLSHSLYGFLET